VVAGYRVEERIGAGGMAVVFRAKDVRLGRTVALKVLSPALAGDTEFRERFIRESMAAAAVDHPHIIPVYAAGEADGILFLAMRWVPNGDLRKLLQRSGRLSPERASWLLSPLASALEAGHQAGLVHRDVKPANILIDTSTGIADHPYLADFGLAKGSESTAGLTGTGQFIGTLDYAAPEQIRGGGRPIPQTDQYALACVAFTMLTGAAPFTGPEPSAVMWAHMYEPPPPVTALRADLPGGVDQVLKRAMAKTPAERYPTCAEFANAFRTALGVGTAGFDANPPGKGTSNRTDKTDDAGPADRRDSGRPGDTVTVLPVKDDRESLGGGSGDITVPVPPSSTGRLRAQRGTLTIAATLFGLLLLGGGAGAVLAAHPWSHPPVLQPAGLVVKDKTTGSLTVDWSGPATGPLPDKYEILRDGSVIAAVAGATTDYTDSGLAPGSSHSYQVIAVRGGTKSATSQALSAQTVVPSLADARLDWNGDVTYTMESVKPPTPHWDKHPGDSFKDKWRLTPRCGSAACSVGLSGYYDGWPIATSLTRSGNTYSGTAQIKNDFYCKTKSDPVTATLTITITPSTAGALGTAWVVKAFSGTAVLYTPEPADFACYAATAQLKVSGAA
jgi:serine/threonine-protein kinase